MTARRDPDYQQALGERLRSIRSQQGLTLQEVEDRSGGEWKAVVVGSYERGDRAVSVAKLARLARFYGVPVAELLPEPSEGGPDEPAERDHIALDLIRLDREPTGYGPVLRYARTIQLQRGDYNGRVLTLRSNDLRALAILFGRTVEDLVADLAEDGMLAGSALR